MEVPGPDPRVTGPANCSPDANTDVSTLLQSWTEIDSSSPAYTCPQLASWIRALGARDFDEEITENAEAWARVMYHDLKLKRGQSWIRMEHFSFFCDQMQQASCPVCQSVLGSYSP